MMIETLTIVATSFVSLSGFFFFFLNELSGVEKKKCQRLVVFFSPSSFFQNMTLETKQKLLV